MRKSRRSRIASINVIPYLDVMLVLLVIFMATAPLFQLGEVRPAKVAAESAAPGVGGILVEYRLNGSLSASLGGERNSFSDVGEVVEFLKSESRCLLYSVVVVGEAEQSHQKVMELYSRIRTEANCENVGLGVQVE